MFLEQAPQPATTKGKRKPGKLYGNHRPPTSHLPILTLILHPSSSQHCAFYIVGQRWVNGLCAVIFERNSNTTTLIRNSLKNQLELLTSFVDFCIKRKLICHWEWKMENGKCENVKMYRARSKATERTHKWRTRYG